MFHIDDELKEFLESGVGVMVGTAGDDGRPQLTPGWGPRVMADRRSMTVFVEPARAEAALQNLRANGRIAVTMASPVSFRSVQLKGRLLAIEDPEEEDNTWVQRHRDAFATETALVGDSMEISRNAWMEDVTRLVLEVDRAYDQTPGPNAGRLL